MKNTLNCAITIVLLAGAISCGTGLTPVSEQKEPARYTATPFTSTIHPIAYPEGSDPRIAALEPSGMVIAQNTIYFISDGPGQRYIYRLVPGGRTYTAQRFIPLRFKEHFLTAMTHTLDIEAIIILQDGFAILDERNRRVYTVTGDGMTRELPHNIDDYNRQHEIEFSNEANAGFEGMAARPGTGTWYLANERSPALIYMLHEKDNRLRVQNHLLFSTITGDANPDIADLYAVKDVLYILYRKKRQVIKLHTPSSTVLAILDYKSVTENLYQSPEGYGFAEGLYMTSDTVFLLLDSNGTAFKSRRGGRNGCMIQLPRHPGF